jgi:hypothetical protein
MVKIEKGVLQERRVMEWLTGSSETEKITSAGAIALAIVGLSGVLSPMMLAISILLFAVGLLLQGSVMGSRFKTIASDTGSGTRGKVEIGGGVTGGLIGGGAGVVLGLLAILGVYPTILLPIAALTFGVSMVLEGAAVSRLNKLELSQACDGEQSRHVGRNAVRSSVGMQIFLGLGAVALGVIALAGVLPIVLPLVAMLAVALSGLVSGTAVSGRMLSSLHCK